MSGASPQGERPWIGAERTAGQTAPQRGADSAGGARRLAKGERPAARTRPLQGLDEDSPRKLAIDRPPSIFIKT